MNSKDICYCCLLIHSVSVPNDLCIQSHYDFVLHFHCILCSYIEFSSLHIIKGIISLKKMKDWQQKDFNTKLTLLAESPHLSMAVSPCEAMWVSSKFLSEGIRANSWYMCPRSSSLSASSRFWNSAWKISKCFTINTFSHVLASLSSVLSCRYT